MFKAKTEYNNLASCAEVLIVDDSDFIVFALQEQFNLLNVRVDVCSSGHEALQRILARLPSEQLLNNNQKTLPMYRLILLDFSMPGGLDGPSTASEIRKILRQKSFKGVQNDH